MKELLLYTSDVASAVREVNQLGGQVKQVFTPALLVAVVPEDASLTASTPNPPSEIDDTSRMMAEAWHSRAKRGPVEEGIPWDTPGFEPPCKR